MSELKNEKAGGIIGRLVGAYKAIISGIAWVLLILAFAIGYSYGIEGAIIAVVATFIFEALFLPPLVILFYIHTELQDIKELLKK